MHMYQEAATLQQMCHRLPVVTPGQLSKLMAKEDASAIHHGKGIVQCALCPLCLELKRLLAPPCVPCPEVLENTAIMPQVELCNQ